MARTPAIITNSERSVMKKFGAKIRYEREKIELSQEKLAQHAKVHRNYVGAVERGEQNIALVNILKISRALKKTISEIFEGIK